MSRGRRPDLHALDLERVCVARLASGVHVDGLAPDWSRTLDVAIFERCAPLAWLRSAHVIRASAPPDVCARWRSHALCASGHARNQVTELATLVAALSCAQVTPVVLKGLPLSVILYGDVAARPVTDADLFVPLAQREQAHDVLVSSGWRHLFGWAPREGTYQKVEAAACPYVEMHSSLLDENLLSHLQLPSPETRLVDLGATSVRAQDVRLLPVFLAAHLAKHADVPLLWWIDFATLYERMPDDDRAVIARAAASARVAKYLDWAIDGTRLLRQVLVGERDEAISAMRSLRTKHDRRNAARVAHLATGILDMCRVWIAWAWPRSQRRRPIHYAWSILRRGGAWLEQTRS